MRKKVENAWVNSSHAKMSTVRKLTWENSPGCKKWWLFSSRVDWLTSQLSAMFLQLFTQLGPDANNSD